MTEAELIALLRGSEAGKQRIGDDCAVLPLSERESYLITKDMLVEDVHFRRSYFTPEELAHKALHVNLSDIAAMGGEAHYVLLGLAIPQSYKPHAESLAYSFANACQRVGVQLVGGDTVGSPDRLILSITVIGKAGKSQVKYRKGARAGDVICVAGRLGYARLGLAILETMRLESGATTEIVAEHTQYTTALKKPKALCPEGNWLGALPGVTAMMDVSDGLAADLAKLCAESKVGARVEMWPLDEEFVTASRELGLDPESVALVGGEDYALLFAVSPEEYNFVEQAFTERFRTPMMRIGEATGEEGVMFFRNGKEIRLKIKPFEHL